MYKIKTMFNQRIILKKKIWNVNHGIRRFFNPRNLYINPDIHSKTKKKINHKNNIASDYKNKNLSLIHNDMEPKGKITVIRRLINKETNTSEILEYKTASSVIRRLNFENKVLFGPAKSSKPKPPALYNQKEIDELGQVIQLNLIYPVSEPCKNTFDLSVLLSFPLMNQYTLQNELKLDDWNSLRKHFEFICKDCEIPSVSSILEITMPNKDLQNQNIVNIKERSCESHKKECQDSVCKYISNYLISIPEEELGIKEEHASYWNSLKSIFPLIKDVKIIEEHVRHPFLCYKGVVDCYAKYKNELVVINWKISNDSAFYNTFDEKLKIAAYVGALNFDPKFHYLAKNGLIVTANKDGLPATINFINKYAMMKYWKQWLIRIKMFWKMKLSEHNYI